MRTRVKDALAIEFVLLPMFEPIEEPISIRSFKSQPGFECRPESSGNINIPVITG